MAVEIAEREDNTELEVERSSAKSREILSAKPQLIMISAVHHI